ncbi:hypothetical protein [Parafrankia discariae]|uniref:hypothetical protein n=1 Tax=Parafrankia discariae TaxID=365528 RepID=UPI0003624A42|nr:hypothetical protein [Parafrankia discariae]
MTEPEARGFLRASLANLAPGIRMIVGMVVAMAVAVSGGAAAAGCLPPLHAVGVPDLLALAMASVVAGLTICLLALAAAGLAHRFKAMPDDGTMHRKEPATRRKRSGLRRGIVPSE